MSVTYEQFVQNLDDLEIMSADEVRAFWVAKADGDEIPDSQKLAGELYRAGKLTKYQAVRVYQNKHQGLLLGNYLILDQLGRGGMGEVFKARHRRMKRLVAVKVLSPSVTQSDQSRRRFQREVEAAAKLVHPNIVTAFDADMHKGIHFLVMEYVDGKDLGVWLKQNGPFTVSQSMDCIIQAARGLQFAHGAGVIHRDIKPQNMLLDGKGCIKILDMGLVSLEDAEDADSSEDLTQHNQIMGSVDYMSPEQAEDVSSVDSRTDIYGLGCTLFRLLTGKPPYPADKLIEKLVAHRQRPIPSLLEVCPDVSPELDKVFQRMIAKDREHRQASMAEVIQDLERCQGLERPEAHRGQSAAVAPVGRTATSSGFEVNYHEEDNVDADSAMLRFVQSLDEYSPVDTKIEDDDSILLESIDDVVTNHGTEGDHGSLPSREATVQKDGDSETMPELLVRRNRSAELSRQWKGRKWVQVLQLIGIAMVVGFSIFAWFKTRQPQLVIEWAPEDRPGVMVILNNQVLEDIPRTNPLRINVQQGTNFLELRRRGFEWIEQQIEVGKGERVKVMLEWEPIAFPGAADPQAPGSTPPAVPAESPPGS
ncbi:MAG: serine/threonine-protein kinase [Pirellulaceae bacterium]